MSFEMRLVPPPTIPDSLEFTNKAGSEKIVLSVFGPNPVDLSQVYRIGAQVFQKIPATNDLGSRLLGRPNASFWGDVHNIKKIEFVYPNDESIELLPSTFELTVRNFNFIEGLGNQKKIDLIPIGDNLKIKAL